MSGLVWCYVSAGPHMARRLIMTMCARCQSHAVRLPRLDRPTMASRGMYSMVQCPWPHLRLQADQLWSWSAGRGQTIVMRRALDGARGVLTTNSPRPKGEG